MAETSATDHVPRFAIETSVEQSPWAMVDQKFLIEAEGGDPEDKDESAE